MYKLPDFPSLYSDARKAAERANSVAEWTAAGYEDAVVWTQEYKWGQTDLYWLCTELLGLDLVESTHRPITDFFVHKNPYIPATNWKDAVAKQSTIKNRLLLYPRGSFKSSIDRADAIQWIICFPNIRVVYMTAEDTLATEFVTATRTPFAVSDGHKLTRFQMLYWEHCIPAKKKEDESVFTSRARKEDLDQPSVRAMSLGASTVGKHGDVGKFDDCVSNKNSGPTSTADSRKKVTSEIKLARNIIDQYGYRDYVGTNYNEDDAYASIESTLSPNLQLLRKPAWVVKAHALRKSIPELLPEDVELLFPVDRHGVPRLTFEAIMTEWNSDPYICSCQLLLNPQAVKVAKFTEQMIRKTIIPYNQFPQPGTFFTAVAWDFAKTDGIGSDRSVGMTGYITTLGPQAGGLYIVEIVRGRFSRSDLPFQLANQANRWKPIGRLGIEKSPGADFLNNDIVRAFEKVGYPDAPAIEWIPVDNHKGAKNARALDLELLFIQNRIFFSDQIPEELMKEVIREFVVFKGDSNRKNDSVDAAAYLAKYLPDGLVVPQTEQEKQNAAWELLNRKLEHERMFPGSDKTGSKFWKQDGFDRQEIVVPPPTHWEGMPIYQNPDQMLYGT